MNKIPEFKFKVGQTVYATEQFSLPELLDGCLPRIYKFPGAVVTLKIEYITTIIPSVLGGSCTVQYHCSNGKTYQEHELFENIQSAVELCYKYGKSVRDLRQNNSDVVSQAIQNFVDCLKEEFYATPSLTSQTEITYSCSAKKLRAFVNKYLKAISIGVTDKERGKSETQ